MSAMFLVADLASKSFEIKAPALIAFLDRGGDRRGIWAWTEVVRSYSTQVDLGLEKPARAGAPKPKDRAITVQEAGLATFLQN